MASTLQIYNTLSREKEPFVPLELGKVKMYACGITVYDEAHIGHASQAIIFDGIRRYLEYLGYQVTYVRNYTDIDDKIINKANQLGKSAAEVAAYYIDDIDADMAALKVKPATYQTKACDYIKQIIEFIAELVKRGYAYESKGEVLFDVTKFKEYGKLSRRKIDELISEENTLKRNPQDFSLWKAAKEGEPSWQSPWGAGRPGWHIECSVMARECLGETFDIHGGGHDLVFPHHENEIAQSEARNGVPFARYWIHNGMVMVNRQKMSKSLGNFYTIKQALQKVEADVVRFIVLSVLYSSNIDFMESSFNTASKRVYYFYKTLLNMDRLLNDQPSPEGKNLLPELINQLEDKFKACMNDNFNTPKVLALLSDAFREINELLETNKIKVKEKILTLALFRNKVQIIFDVLGLFNENPREFLERFKSRFLMNHNIDPSQITKLIEERVQARKEKNFSKADDIRDELLQMKIALNDTPQGTEWDIIW